MGFVGIDVQMSHLDLRARPGQTRFPLEDIRVAIFFCERHGVLARRGHPGRENNLRSFVRLQAYAATETEDWIEHGSDGV